MEAAKIEWSSIESVFVKDEVYENINAPQWVDLLSPSQPNHHSDVAWFCRPDCKHPTTAQDFLNSTPPPPSKLLRSVSVSKLIGLVDWNRRDPNLKRRGTAQSSTATEDTENHDPNFTTPNHQAKYLSKAAFKWSAQKSEQQEEEEYSDIFLLNSGDKSQPRLKATHSAKDLFAGRDLFAKTKITDLCHELKKLASRTNDSEEEQQPLQPAAQTPTRNLQRQPSVINPSPPVLGPRSDKTNKLRMPLLEVRLDRHAAAPVRSIAKDKFTNPNFKRADEAENIPVSLDLNVIKRKQEEKLLPIRTNPPTPQGFSATRDPAKTTPPKAHKSRLKVGSSKTEVEVDEKNEESGRTLDVFWFLKPCTLSS